MDFISYLVRLRIIPFLKKWNLLMSLLGFIDIMAIALAFQFSYYINYFKTGGFFFTERNLLLLFLTILPFWLLILYLIKIAEIPRTKRYRVLLFEFIQSALVIGVFLLIAYFLFKMVWISRLFLMEFTLFGFMFLFLVRLLEYKVFKTYRSRGYNYVNVVLIANDSSQPFIEELLFNKEWGYRIIAIVTDSSLLREKYEKNVIILPEQYIKVLNDLMEVDIIDEVLYIKNRVVPSEVRNVIRSCEELGVIFRLKYEGKEINLTNAIKTNIGDEKFLSFINIPYKSYALAIKKILDINISLIIIIVLSPVLLIIAVLIKISSPGPIVYKQIRVGLRGRQFPLYKFRTMVVNADALKKDLETENEMDGPVFKIKNDPRVTNIGKGEMSLIGPRPPIPSETRQYKRWQLRRLSVKPGLSCFWQIKPDRNSIKFEKWMELDLAYIDNWSLRLDFIILLKTIKTVFQRTGL
jgi:lipopolysaccharide/colanic/teichoic acid biosynthesis glycosyltransferase